MFDEPHSPEWIDNAIEKGTLNIEKILSVHHFHSYYMQIKEMVNLKINSILEIGPGENFAANYLKNSGIQYDTMDIIKNSNPTILSKLEDVDAQKYKQNYDLVCEFQVLEHSPYQILLLT